MELRQSKELYIVTTPLQMLFVVSLLRRDPQKSLTELILVGRFANEGAIVRKLIEFLPQLHLVRYFANFLEAMPYITAQQPDRLFLDTDVGVQKYMQLARMKMRNPRLRIAVYEEGLGTYRDDLYSGSKEWLLRLIGAGTYFGGCALTSEIHVLRPELYRKTFPKARVEIHPIMQSPVTVIRENYEGIRALFDYEPIRASGDQCTLYLGKWTVDPEYLQKLASSESNLFFKPHPHCQWDDTISSLNVLPTHVPAELILEDLIAKYRRVKVYHHGSSVTWYHDDPATEFIRI